MHATIRRDEAIDQTRTNEPVKKAEDSLLPRLSQLPGFNGYYLIDAGNGVFSSVDFFAKTCPLPSRERRPDNSGSRVGRMARMVR